MAYDITLEGNYLYIDNNGIDLLDYPSGDVIFEKKLLNGEEFCVYKRGYPEHGYQGVRWDDFTLDGVPFASLAVFETWKNENTGIATQGTATPVTPPTPQTLATNVVEATVDGSTLSGVKSVALWFRGNGGTLDGVPQPNNATPSFSPNNDVDTIGSIPFTVPTTGQSRVIIYYVL